jgi:PAS domain S-box-containing protein
MASGSRVIVITPDAEEAVALAAALRGATVAAFDVLTAGTPADALREPAFRDAPLVLYDCAVLAKGARLLRDLFPHAAAVAVSRAGDEAVVQGELEAGAADFLLRDPGRVYLRLLPLKAARLLKERSPAERQESGMAADSILRLEANLRQSEIRFGQLVQAIPDIVYHLDPEGNFIFVNASVATLEYAPEDLIGRHFSTVIHPEDLPYVSRSHVVRRHHDGTLEAGATPKLFDERRSGDRRTRGLVVRLMIRPGGTSGASHKIGDVVSYGVIEAMGHYDEAKGHESGASHPDSFRGTVGIIHDVTLHRRSEEMIRVLLQAVDQSPVPIAVMDSGGTVEYVNPLFLRDSGLLPEQVIGRNVAHLTESLALRSFFRILAEASNRGGEWRGRLPDAGSPSGLPWPDLYVSPVRDPLGRTSHFIAVLAGDGVTAGP